MSNYADAIKLPPNDYTTQRFGCPIVDCDGEWHDEAASGFHDCCPVHGQAYVCENCGVTVGEDDISTSWCDPSQSWCTECETCCEDCGLSGVGILCDGKCRECVASGDPRFDERSGKWMRTADTVCDACDQPRTCVDVGGWGEFSLCALCAWHLPYVKLSPIPVAA